MILSFPISSYNNINIGKVDKTITQYIRKKRRNRGELINHVIVHYIPSNQREKGPLLFHLTNKSRCL